MTIAEVTLAGGTFFNNALGCSATLGIAAWKRSRHRVRVTEDAVQYPGDFTTAVAAGARACFRRLLAGLHESRRRQAAIEQARYRHLMVDIDTRISFDSHAARQKPPSAE
jgi:hypothetical protein